MERVRRNRILRAGRRTVDIAELRRELERARGGFTEWQVGAVEGEEYLQFFRSGNPFVLAEFEEWLGELRRTGWKTHTTEWCDQCAERGGVYVPLEQNGPHLSVEVYGGRQVASRLIF